jgi:predicted CXXCH cytochrome family protein
MKRLIRRIQILTITTALLGLPMAALAGIEDTSHDFSTASWNTSGEICIVCHTPHDAMAVTDAPLWNHETTTATFAVYDSPTMEATPGAPSGVSLLCLSCHDGTVAIDSFGNPPATGTISATGAFLKGTDLSNDHPISMTYDTGDAGLNPLSTLTGTTTNDTIDAELLFAGEVQCASCHDPHDAASLGVGGNFLIKSNAASAVCLVCHNK